VLTRILLGLSILGSTVGILLLYLRDDLRTTISSLFALSSLGLIFSTIFSLPDSFYAVILTFAVVYFLTSIRTYYSDRSERALLGSLIVLSALGVLVNSLFFKIVLIEGIAIVAWLALRNIEKSAAHRLLITVNVLAVIPLLTYYFAMSSPSTQVDIIMISRSMVSIGLALAAVLSPMNLLSLRSPNKGILVQVLTVGIVLPGIMIMELLEVLSKGNFFTSNMLLIALGVISLIWIELFRLADDSWTSIPLRTSQEGFSYAIILLGAIGSLKAVPRTPILEFLLTYVIILYCLIVALLAFVLYKGGNHEEVSEVSFPGMRVLMGPAIIALLSAIGAPSTGGFSWRGILYKLLFIGDLMKVAFIVVLLGTVMSFLGYTKSFAAVYMFIRGQGRPLKTYEIIPTALLSVILLIVGLLPSFMFKALYWVPYDVNVYGIEKLNLAFLAAFFTVFVVIYALIPASIERRDVWTLGERVPETLYRMPIEEYFDPLIREIDAVLLLKKRITESILRSVMAYAATMIVIEAVAAALYYLLEVIP